MGRISGSIPTGRNGKGILVSAGGGDNNNMGGNFTSLSLYRYRAAVKKQHKEDDRGKRLQYRQTMNMNKMNKKGNNITTGVVTSQQPR
jgi:pre-60S factor REI1